MKKTGLWVLLLLWQVTALSQDAAPERTFDKSVKWAPLSLTLGSVSLNGEYNLGRSSVTLRVGIPVSAHHDITVFDNGTDFSMRAFSLLAGYRRYLSEQHMRGFYVEPFLQYVRHKAAGTGTGDLGGRKVLMDYTNTFSAGGLGAQLGVQFIIRQRVVLDLFLLGPVMNYGSDRFFARENGNNIPWTNAEAEDATQRINDAIEDFPFLRNHTTINIDAATRTANARFRGLLPGLRGGLSIGVVF